MIYTIDNPKLVTYYTPFEGIETFTGVVKDKYGTIAYYLNGKTHREGGPAVIFVTGDKQWWLNGKIHKEDGPAVEWVNGNKQWWLNGKIHREDGPAFECTDGSKAWYLNNKHYGYDDDYTNKSWIKFVKLELLK